MAVYDVDRFNQEMRERTFMLSVSVYGILRGARLDDLSRTPVRQLVKSVTSVTANYSSATRGRSEAEFYSKICIVTEECDETLLWIRFMEETGILSKANTVAVKKEAEELMRIFSSIKKKLKIKLQK